MSGYAGLSNGLVQGFSMMNQYYANRDARERQNRLDTENQRRWNITNKRQAGIADLQTKKLNMQIDNLSKNQAADLYSGIAYDQKGNPIDLSKLSPDEVQAKKQQLQEVINRTPEFKSILAQNPNVDPNNPLADMQLIYDQKTQQPSAVFDLRMKDGSVKPMTEMRSDAQNDGVVVMPLSEVHRNVMSVLGNHGRLKSLDATAKAAAVKAADHQFELNKIDYQNRGKMAVEAFKQGYALDKNGKFTGAKARLAGKRLASETKQLGSFLKTNYGAEGMNGMVSLDGTGKQFSWASLIGQHMLATGQSNNYADAGTRAMQIADQIKQDGGNISYVKGKGWMVWDGSTDDNGNRTGVSLLFNGPQTQQGLDTVKPSSKTAPTKTTTSYDDAVKMLEAKAGRPLTEAEKVKVKARYGVSKKQPAATGTVQRDSRKTGMTPKPVKKVAAQKPVKTPKATKRETLSRLEAKLKADIDLKKGGSGGIGLRAIKAKRFPLGMAERKTLERRIKRLRKELASTKESAGLESVSK